MVYTFDKDKSAGANQHLIALFPVFLVTFLFDFKSQAHDNFLII